MLLISKYKRVVILIYREKVIVLIKSTTWLETFGPFYSDGNNNDESIYNLLFNKSSEAEQFCEDLNTDRSLINLIDTPQSIRILDRIFVRQKVDEKVIYTIGLKSGEKQFETCNMPKKYNRTWVRMS